MNRQRNEPTPFIEANALLYLQQDDEEAALAAIRELLPGELVALARAASILSEMCRSERRRR